MPVESEFTNQRALITGGGTGIGKGCAEYLAGLGARVTICGPDESILQEASKDINDKTGKQTVNFIFCDVTDETAVEKAVAFAAGDNNLDIMLCNAGTGMPGPVQLLDKEQWQYPYNVNVVGSALCMKHAAAIMRQHGGGAIVAISSIEAQRANINMPSYAATKAALDSLVANAARELAPFGIRVNGIRPGVIETDALKSSLGSKSKKGGQKQTWLGRPGTPLDIAKGVAFFSSSQSEWITGQMLNICGGLSIHDGANYERVAKMVFGDEAIDALKPES